MKLYISEETFQISSNSSPMFIKYINLINHYSRNQNRLRRHSLYGLLTQKKHRHHKQMKKDTKADGHNY